MRGMALRAGLSAAVALTMLVAIACVDLESLGSGVRSDVDANAGSDASTRFCVADSGALFCDDFDDPDLEPSALWPGAEAVLPSPASVGNARFERVLTSTSSPPFAVGFIARRERDERRPFVAFGRELGALPAARAIALAAEVRLEELTDLELPNDAGDAADAGDAGDAGDASDADSSADAASDSASDADAGLPRPNPNVVDVPDPHVPVIGLLSIGADVSGVQAVLSGDRLFVVAGGSQATLSRVPVGTIDYLEASKLAWIRLVLFVGEPEVVEQTLRARTGNPDITCPRTPAVAALWASLPVGAARCIEAPDGFAGLAARRLAATIGVGLDTASSARVSIDSVRVDAIR